MLGLPKPPLMTGVNAPGTARSMDRPQGAEYIGRRTRVEASTYQEIQELSRLTINQLRERYLDVFGEETRNRYKEFLRKRDAWRLLARAEGDVSERARRRAARVRPCSRPQQHPQRSPYRRSERWDHSGQTNLQVNNLLVIIRIQRIVVNRIIVPAHVRHQASGSGASPKPSAEGGHIARKRCR